METRNGADAPPLPSLETLHALFERAPLVAIVADGQGTCLSANRRAIEATGYAVDELRGQPLLELIHADDRGGIEAAMAGLKEDPRQALSAECRCLRKDGSCFAVHLSAWALCGATGAVEAALAVAGDVPPRPEMADLVRQTQMAAIGRLSAALAHELRNPLSVVRNTVYVLKRKLAQGDTSQAAEYLDMIEQEMVNADRILKELIAATRAETPKRKPTALAEVVAAAQTRAAAPKTIEWDCALPDVMLDVDPDQMALVFRHLFTNAIQAMGGAGRISVRSEPTPEGALIAVIDSGPGIPPESLEQVFEPLFSTKPRRPGLGLTVCRQICERHGGTIHAEPRPSGAEFHLRLPCC